MKRSGALAAGVLAVVLSLTPAAGAAQKVTIAMSAPEVFYAPFFIAAQKGYFAEQGLDVQLIFAGGGISTPALLSGSIDASASSASALTAILRGGALRIIVVFNDHPPYKIWASSEIHSLADLKGKSIGVATRGDTNEIATRLAMKAADIPADAIDLIQLGSPANRVAAFESGTIPAVVLSTSETVAMQDQGQLKNAHVLVDLSSTVHLPMTGLAVSEKMLSGDTAAATKMMRAIVEGARYMKAFKNETVAIVGKYQNVPNTHANELEYDEFLRAITKDYTVSDDQINADLAVREGLLRIPKEKVPPIDKMYDFSIVRAINAELDASNWKPTR